MQNNIPLFQFSKRKSALALAGTLLIAVSFAAQCMALPFGKAKEDEIDILAPVAKLKLTKEQQTEYDASFKNGNTYLKQANFELALICFQRCATLNPNSAGAHLGLAHCYVGLRKPEQAQMDIFECLKNDPANIQARFLLGDMMMKDARWDEAGGQYFQVLKQNPDDLAARGNLANCLMMMNQIDSAIGQYKYILEKDPKNATASYNLGAMYELQNDYDKAADAYKKTLQLDKSNVNAYCSLAKCFMAKKDYVNAQKLLDFSNKLSPKSYFVHLMQGYLYEIRGEKRNAIEEYTRAVALNPADMDSKGSLARMLQSGGDGGAIKKNTGGIRLSGQGALK